MHEVYIIVIAGCIGAFISELLKDNCIELPKKIGPRFSLGILGSMIVGAITGYYVDGSPETAFMAGFMGPQLLSSILKKRIENFKTGKKTEIEAQENTEKKPETKAEIEKMIREKAKLANVDENLAVAVAKCESSLNPNAININKTGSKDRGIYQWNDKYHPEITDKMAFDPETATDLFLLAVNQGNLGWWKASQGCWGKYK